MPDKNIQTNGNFFERMRNLIGYYNFYSRMVELLFLKYLVTFADQLDLKDIQSYKAVSEFKRKYDEARNGAYVINRGDITDLLISLDYLKGESNVSLSIIADHLSFFYDAETQIQVLDMMDSLVMKNDRTYFTEAFDYLLCSSFNDVSKTGGYITGKALRSICMKLLNVKGPETYLDCYAGYSSSLIESKEINKYIGYELNIDASAVSLITSIMLGIKDYRIINGDFLSEETDETADKVLSDVIFGYKRDLNHLASKYGVNTKDLDVLSFYKTFYAAKEKGSVVITVPGKFLFSTAKAYVELREKITKNGLRAVISLPALWQGFSMGTNLIYIDKTYTEEIEFVDASKLVFSEKRSSFTNLGNVGNVVDSIKELWSDDGFCNYVGREEVLKQGTWLPERYVKHEPINSYRKVEEIDKELDSLYAQLQQNMK